MACPLQALPPEIEEMIIEALEDLDEPEGDPFFAETILPLSATCKHFRELLAPRIFFCLEFTNEPDSADFGLQMAKKYGTCFKRLHFIGMSKTAKDVKRKKGKKNQLPWGEREDDLLCPAARELLLGTHTPNAAFVNIRFEFNFKDKNSEFALTPRPPTFLSQITELFGDRETDGEIKKRELEQPWRALMKLVWQTLQQNQVVRSLEASRMIPKLSSAFQDSNPSWRQFLGKLKRMSLSFSKEDDPLHLAWGCAGVDHFMESLSETFLSPAVRVQTLSIVGPEHGLLGRRDRIALEKLYFPRLTSVDLSHICLDESLIDFFKAHTKTLQMIILIECWSCESEIMSGDEQVKWAQVFRALKDPDSELRFFTCLPHDSQCYGTFADTIVSPEEFQEWEECDAAFKESKGKRAFPYAFADLEFRSLEPSPELVLASLREGEDQKAYDELQAQLKQTLARSGRLSMFRDFDDTD